MWEVPASKEGKCAVLSREELVEEPFPRDYKILVYGNSHLRQVSYRYGRGMLAIQFRVGMSLLVICDHVTMIVLHFRFFLANILRKSWFTCKDASNEHENSQECLPSLQSSQQEVTPCDSV